MRLVTVTAGVLAVLNFIMLLITLLASGDRFFVILFGCGACVTGFFCYAEWAKEKA